MPSARLATRRFRGVLLRSILVPLLLMLALAGTFVWQIRQLIEHTDVVEAADRSIAQLNRLERLHVDLESGLRGYLVAGQPLFLEPYTAGRRELDPLFDALGARLAGDADATRRLAEIRRLRDEWVTYAERQIARRDAGDASWLGVLVGGEGKRTMDAIRARFDELIARHELLRDARNEAVQRRAQAVVITACGLAALAGLAIAHYTRRELAALGRTYEAALAEARDLSATLERRVEERTAEVTRGNERLAEANRELEAFSYSVSHDLRAPMRHIAGFADLVRTSARDKLSGDDVENLDTIRDTAVLAGRMVDDLLAFSRVGRTKLRQVPVDMNLLVRKSVDALAPELAGRQVEWSIAELPPAVGDPALLKMVWQNLLANAVKYTGKKPSARIEVGATPDEDGSATYFVRDDGVGFDMAYAHKLFGVFQRLHRAEEFDGTGIGLANVRRIILRHGGQVSVDGKLNAGATFSFRLPRRPADVEGNE